MRKHSHSIDIPYINSFDIKLKTEYTLEKEPIGTGSFSKVYKAVDSLGRECAIKKIAVSRNDNEKYNKYLLELDISKKIEHKNIIQCYDVGSSQNYLYIISEYCNLGSFSDLIQSIKNVKPIEKEKLLKYYLCQLKNAIQYLYNNGIVHRDLKPDNILLHNLGNEKNGVTLVKLADMGFARYYNNKHTLDNDFIESSLQIKQNMIETICGSPLYMAPELILHKTYNMKADLWSFGIIMYELLYGYNPFTITMLELKIDILQNTIRNTKIKLDNIYSKSCMNLINKLLQKDPSKRIDWNDFFNHQWFKSDDDIFEIDDIFDDEPRKMNDIFDEPHKMDDSCDVESTIIDKSSVIKYSEHNFIECIDDYVDKHMSNDDKIKKSSENSIQFMLDSDKKLKTYRETESSSVMKLLAESISSMFSYPKSF